MGQTETPSTTSGIFHMCRPSVGGRDPAAGRSGAAWREQLPALILRLRREGRGVVNSGDGAEVRRWGRNSANTKLSMLFTNLVYFLFIFFRKRRVVPVAVVVPAARRSPSPSSTAGPSASRNTAGRAVEGRLFVHFAEDEGFDDGAAGVGAGEQIIFFLFQRKRRNRRGPFRPRNHFIAAVVGGVVNFIKVCGGVACARDPPKR